MLLLLTSLDEKGAIPPLSNLERRKLNYFSPVPPVPVKRGGRVGRRPEKTSLKSDGANA
jgi:hypothetical protein